MTEKNYSSDLQRLFTEIERLFEEADKGSFEALQRVKAIEKLANPIYDFSPSDYQRILKKKLPLPVQKGIKLYKLMQELTYLVQPIGKKKGRACFVRRVDYENLTWDEFLDFRGTFSAGFVMEAMKQRGAPKFYGFNLLSERQKELYHKIGVYFGNKKKPTLQSLAINVLNQETNGADYSERSLYIYLDAIKEYQARRKKAAGFDVFNFTTHSVASFNDENRTIRQSIEDMDKAVARIILNSKDILVNTMSNQLMDLIPAMAEKFAPKIVFPQIENIFQFPQFKDLFRSIFANPIYSKNLIKEKDED